MGSRAYLQVDSVTIRVGYYDIPWESLFLFTEDDFVEEIETDDLEEYRHYYYRVSAERARATAESHGLTLKFCEAVFENYRDDRTFWANYLMACDENDIFPEISATEVDDRASVDALIKKRIVKRDQGTLAGIDVSRSRLQILKEYVALKLRKNEPLFSNVGFGTEWEDMEHYLTSPLHGLPWQIRTVMLALNRAETLTGSLAYMRLRMRSTKRLPASDWVP